MRAGQAGFDRRLPTRQRRGTIFQGLCIAATMVGLVILFALLGDIFRKGAGSLDGQFLTSYPSRFPEQAGIKSALWGTLWVISLTALFTFPLGVGAAIYLEEYARRNWLTKIIQVNIDNLAGVPSIVYGILGLALFVRALGLGRSVLSGSLTMTLLTLPIVIIASQEALRAVPQSQREASYALGATRWQTVRHVVLPSALPAILTGTILALSRAIGEAAPLMIMGALAYVAFVPSNPLDPFTVLPIQVYNWTARPQDEFRALAAAAIIVLLVVLLSLNATAIFLRDRYQRKTHG